MLTEKDFKVEKSSWFLGGSIYTIHCSKNGQYLRRPTMPLNDIFSWEFNYRSDVDDFIKYVEKGRFQNVNSLNKFLKKDWFRFSDHNAHNRWVIDLDAFEKAVNKRCAIIAAKKEK